MRCVRELSIAVFLAVAASFAFGGDGRGARVLKPVAFAEAPPLAKVTPVGGRARLAPEAKEEHPLPPWINGRGASPSPTIPFQDSLVQTLMGPLAMPAPSQNFEGNGVGLPGFVMSFAPPDTEGDVGPNHYVQWVNTMFAIWDKSGTLLYGPADGRTLFASLAPNKCATSFDVDPLVMYDAIADRWFMSAAVLSAPPFYQCVAVSATSDPVNGGWYVWAFDFGTSFNDYTKSGVWPDGYYTTYTLFPAVGSGYIGAEVCAFDRTAMLAGDPGAAEQCFGPDPNYGALLPSHLNLGGTQMPPAGSPNYVMALGASRQLLLWPFHVDWANPANSTFPFDSPTIVTVAPYLFSCGGTGAACIPQLGTLNRLDSLGDRLMWRLNYRNFGTHESLVVNHSVDTSFNGATAIRWYEIRSPGTTPTAHQQGTYAPDLGSRWMGSINMDVNQNMALGYSLSSAGMNPSIRYSGRLSTDPPGTLPQAEATLQAGTGSQLAPLNRWGDYSTMSVDPSDGCTFWYTQQYLATNGTFNWRTRIGSFKFPECTNVCPAITGAFSGGGSICPGGSTTVTVTVSGGRPPYLVTLDNGGGSQLGDGPAFTFTVSPAATTTYAVTYLSDDNGCLGSGSGSASVTVDALPAITATPADAVACAGGGAAFAVAATGTGLTYQWQVDEGAGFADLVEAPPYSGVTTPILTIAGAGAALNGARYRAVASGTCPPPAVSATATLTVKTVTPIPPTLPGAAAGSAYAVTLSGSGGVAPYTFAGTSLPDWLSLTPDGAQAGSLSGTPTVAGTFTFAVTATDSAGCSGAPQPYSIVVSPGPPATIVTVSGTPQRTTVNSTFADPLSAAVRDAFDNPVQGVTVTFTAPAAGPSGTFPGGAATIQVVTDAAGVATTPLFMANPVPGSYQVTASIELPGGGGGTTSAAFDLTNLEPIPALGPLGVMALILLVAGAGVLVLGWRGRSARMAN